MISVDVGMLSVKFAEGVRGYRADGLINRILRNLTLSLRLVFKVLCLCTVWLLC